MTQCAFLSDSPLPGNLSSWKSTPVAPHTLSTCGIHWLCSNNIYVQFTCITMYHLAVPELPVQGFSWKFLSWNQRSFRIPKLENIDVGVWLYWCYIIWQLHICFLYTLFFKTFLTLQFNRRNTVHFKMGQFVAGMGEWVCSRWLCGGFGRGCVCVGIICVVVKEFKCFRF